MLIWWFPDLKSSGRLGGEALWTEIVISLVQFVTIVKAQWQLAIVVDWWVHTSDFPKMSFTKEFLCHIDRGKARTLIGKLEVEYSYIQLCPNWIVLEAIVISNEIGRQELNIRIFPAPPLPPSLFSIFAFVFHCLIQRVFGYHFDFVSLLVRLDPCWSRGRVFYRTCYASEPESCWRQACARDLS